jgi:hypothetical protein
MPERPRVVHLDDLDAIPGPGTLTWHPVRAHLGIRAFGCNAYSAQREGDDVVEPHTENPEDAHEELYFVARGRATFMLDDETFDAPEGTYVFVPDPATHRHAVAAEPDTTVLSFGGPATFTPSAWEWSFRADPLLTTDPEKARAIVEEGLEQHPDSPSLLIFLARLEVRAGNEDKARELLARAFERQAESVELARQDPRLAALL